MTWIEPVVRLAGTALTREQLLPDVALTEASTGRTWRPSELRQRQALVLCFVHSDCDGCGRFVARLKQNDHELLEADARVYVVLSRPAAWPFPVLVDAAGEARNRLLGPDAQVPIVLVADRYTAAVASYPAASHAFPDPTELVGTVRHLAMLCPECSV